MESKIVRRGVEYYMEVDDFGGESYEYEMMFANTLEGFLKFSLERTNQKPVLLYNVTGYKPFREIQENMWINERYLRSVVERILTGIETVKRYLLYPDNLVLDIDNLFINPSSNQLVLIYAPGYQKDILVQIQELLEFLMTKIDSDDVQAVMLGWKLYKVTKEERVNIRSIEECLHRTHKIQSDEIIKTPTVFEKEQEKENMGLNRQKKIKNLLIGAFTMDVFLLLSMLYIVFHIYFYGILEWKRNLLVINGLLLAFCCVITISLYGKRKREREVNAVFDSTVPRLLSSEEQFQNIFIVKTPFTIGKMQKEVDCCLNDPVISRVHAKVQKKKSTYYIMDMASTNGTYLNDIKLEAKKEYKIQAGDCIRLANREFRFFT